MSETLDTGVEPVETPDGAVELVIETEFNCPDEAAEVAALGGQVEQLTATLETIRQRGAICLGDVMALESICPGILMDIMPSGGWSNEPSDKGHVVAMEMASNVAMGVGIAAALAIAIIIKKIIDMIFKMFDGFGKSGTHEQVTSTFTPKLDDAKKDIVKTMEKIQKIHPKTPMSVQLLNALNKPFDPQHKVQAMHKSDGSALNDMVHSCTTHLHEALDEYTKLTGRSVAGKPMYRTLREIDPNDLPFAEELIAKAAKPVLFAGDVHHNIDAMVKFVVDVSQHAAAQLEQVKADDIKIRTILDNNGGELELDDAPFMRAQKAWLNGRGEDFKLLWDAQFTNSDKLSTDQLKVLLASLTDTSLHAKTHAMDVAAKTFIDTMHGKYEVVANEYKITIQSLQDRIRRFESQGTGGDHSHAALVKALHHAQATQAMIKSTLRAVGHAKALINSETAALEGTIRRVMSFVKQLNSVAKSIEKAVDRANNLEDKDKFAEQTMKDLDDPDVGTIYI